MAKRRRVKKRKVKYRWGKIFSIFLMLFALVYLSVNTIAPFVMRFFEKPYVIVAVEPADVYGVEVITSFLDENAYNRPQTKRVIKYIVIHETGNYDYGSNAKMHDTYLHTHPDVDKSWHYTVDDHEIYHHLPDDEVGWHAGDGHIEDGGNLNGIGIEICLNQDGDYEKALDNAAKLVTYLLISYRLDFSDIKQHYDFVHKNCPQNLRDSGRWNEFITKIEDYYTKFK